MCLESKMNFTCFVLLLSVQFLTLLEIGGYTIMHICVYFTFKHFISNLCFIFFATLFCKFISFCNSISFLYKKPCVKYCLFVSQFAFLSQLFLTVYIFTCILMLYFYLYSLENGIYEFRNVGQ